ncbi:MAG: pseudouridine synthase [Spirochaetaceae bacterium]|nr:pseudouridine synthase [Spirochaetaceae bacterium]
MAINKPAGLQVHGQKGFKVYDTLVGRLQKLYPSPPSPAHRLDRPTSGVMILGFDSSTLSKLNEDFRNRKIQKTYLAVVRGWPEKEGEIDIELKKYQGETMQSAKTGYKRLATVELPFANNRYAMSRYALVEVNPRTGRFHQIRRHFARIGHPIIGDTSHGDTRHNLLWKNHLTVQRLLLHSWKITFQHPKNQEILELTAPRPCFLDKSDPFWNENWQSYLKSESPDNIPNG